MTRGRPTRPPSRFLLRVAPGSDVPEGLVRRGDVRFGAVDADLLLEDLVDDDLEVAAAVALDQRPGALDQLLPRADFVIMTIPHTPQTEGLMGAERFKLMKRSAFLINIGRGMTVKLDDLVAALNQGELAGAGLDVFEQEPLPADHPLWTMPNVLLTPHTAGYGPYLDDRRLEILLDNAHRLAAGQPLRNVVDKANWS